MVQYRIEWKHMDSHYSGNGEWHDKKDKKLLEEWITYSNRKCEIIHHWLQKSR